MTEADALKQIRNRRLPTDQFRKLVNALSKNLARRIRSRIPSRQRNQVVLVLILRSSLAMLPGCLRYFPHTPVGFLGFKRNERTAVAYQYYENLPRLNRNSVVVIPDPMLATGGTLTQVIGILKKRGVRPANIYFAGFLAAKPGLARLSRLIPRDNMVLLAVDPNLNRRKFIVPGLGDFGDRYFGLI